MTEDECRNIGSRYTFECSICHHRTQAGETATFLIDGNHLDGEPVPFEYCPHCGRRVVGYGEWDRWNDVVVPTDGDGLG